MPVRPQGLDGCPDTASNRTFLAAGALPLWKSDCPSPTRRSAGGSPDPKHIVPGPVHELLVQCLRLGGTAGRKKCAGQLRFSPRGGRRI